MSVEDYRPVLMPRLSCSDPGAAIDFLCRAFGFEETGRHAPGGMIVHAELALNGQTLLAVGMASPGVISPSELGGNTSRLFCYVDDVDAHCAQARSAGARIVAEPKDQVWGDRTYDVLDAEGYCWTFRQHVRDVPLEDLPGAAPSPQS